MAAFLSDFFMVVANLAVIMLTPAHYVAGIPTLTVFGYSVPLGQMSVWGFAAYGVSNWASARWGSPATRSIDFFLSGIAALVINVTFVQVFRAHPVVSFETFTQMPFDRHVLWMATVYSWYDVIFRQRTHWVALWGAISRIVAVALALLVLGFFLALAFGVDVSAIRERLSTLDPSRHITLPEIRVEAVRCTGPGRQEIVAYATGGEPVWRLRVDLNCK